MAIDHIQGSIQRVIGFLIEHPEKSRYTDKAATSVLESGLRFRATGPEGAILISDMSKVIGGSGSAPSPGWLLRAALANCDATVIAMRAAQLGVSLTKLEVTVDSVSDDRGIMGMDETIPAGPLNMRIRVRIGAENADEGTLKKIVDWAEAHSPVGDAVRRAVPLEMQIEIV